MFGFLVLGAVRNVPVFCIGVSVAVLPSEAGYEKEYMLSYKLEAASLDEFNAL
jgi:hypothetical protein